MRVWVMVVDCGLNGAGVAGVWAEKPSDEVCEQIIEDHHWRGTGYGGWELHTVAITP